MKYHGKLRRTVLATLLAAAPLAHAADETGKGYVMPQAGYTWTDSDRLVDDDYYFALGIGKHLSERWSLELNGVGGKYDAPAGGELNLRAISLDLLRVFNRAGAVSPFISLGAGYIEDNFDPGPTEGDALGQVGLGLLLDVAESSRGTFLFQLRPEVKARWDGNDLGVDDPVDYMAGVGFVLAFGPERSNEPATPPVAMTPPPKPEPVVEPPRPPVPAPEPPPAAPEIVVLEGVHFAVNSAQLTASSLPVLERVAEQLQRHPGLKIEVQGHTDSSGKDDYNLRLSQQRAEAVKDYLMKQGMSPNQLSAKGYGETQPIADNATPAGRDANRRVSMSVIENPERVKIEISRR